MKFKAGGYIKPLYTEDYFIADVYGGRGRGGSHGITQHALFSMMTKQYFRGFFVRAIHGHIRDSLWQDFKDRIQELSDLNNYEYSKHFKIVDNNMSAIYLPNGNQMKSKGFKASSKGNTAHMKSIAGATHIYGEEWEEVGQEENNKLMDSLRTIKAPIKIIRSWNPPPKDHWLIKEYFTTIKSEHKSYYKLVPKEIEGHLAIFGTYKDNLENLDSNTIARYKGYEKTFPRYYYTQIKGLVADGGDSKVYYNWKPISLKEFLNLDAVTVYGIDFGDTSPTSVCVVKYKDGCFYRHEVLYKPLRALAEEYRKKIEHIKSDLDPHIQDNPNNNIWTKHKGILTYVFNLIGIDKNTYIFCDPAQETLIKELRISGYKAVKGNKTKKANINFINRANNYYTDTSTNIVEEYENYYLEKDINKVPIDGVPRKGKDHIMDAQEYACAGIRDLLGLIL